MRFKLFEGSPTATLKLSVLDETENKPELIGDAVIQLNPAYQTLPTDGYDMWHELTYKGKYAGEVYLEMTFYSDKPMARRPKQRSSVSAAVHRNSTMSSSMTSSFYDYTGSLNFSSTMIGMGTSRPLPSQPLAATVGATPAASSSLATTIAMARGPVAASAQNFHIPTPPDLSSSSFNMSTMSRSLPNPLDFQIACEIDMPAIPTESQIQAAAEQYSHMDQQQYSEDEFVRFFNTPIPDTQENFPSAAQPYGESYKPLPQFTSQQSPLSRSTGSDVDFLQQPLSPTSSSDLNASVMSRSLPVTPGQRPCSQGSTGSQEMSDASRMSTKMSIRRKPIGAGAGGAGKPDAILPYPGAKYSVADPLADGHGLNDDEDVKEIPFSADSYVSKKSLPQTPQQHRLPPSPPKEQQRVAAPLPSPLDLSVSGATALHPPAHGLKPLPPSPPMKLAGEEASFDDYQYDHQYDHDVSAFDDSFAAGNSAAYYKPQPPLPGDTQMSASVMSASVGSVARGSPLPRVRGGRASPSTFMGASVSSVRPPLPPKVPIDSRQAFPSDGYSDW